MGINQENQRRETNPRVEKKAHEMTLSSVFFFLLFVFISLLAMLLYIRYSNIFHLNAPIKKPVYSGSVSDRIKDQLKKQDAQSEEATLVLWEEDLTNLLGSTKDPILKNPQAKINKEKIVVSGKMNNIVGLKVEMSVVPKVENGKIVCDIKEIKALGVPAPKEISQKLNGQVSNYLDGAIKSSNIEPTEISLHDQFVQIKGKRK